MFFSFQETFDLITIHLQQMMTRLKLVFYFKSVEITYYWMHRNTKPIAYHFLKETSYQNTERSIRSEGVY